MTDPFSCSAGSLAAGEQLAGSAPGAVAWVALEQNGPWGPRALTDSHLDKDLGRAIEAAALAHQTRASLIRCPGRHADMHAHTPQDPRRLLVAFTHPDNTWLLEASLGEPEQVLRLDWAALQCGDLEAVRRSLPVLNQSLESHLLVCTNGTRDVCCAMKGRPVALGLAKLFTENIWEVTHTSGHRFAPTTVLLPSGTLHGRLNIAAAADVLRAAERGETVLAGSRGRSTWPAAAQVAELAVREETGEFSLTALAVTSHAEGEPSSPGAGGPLGPGAGDGSGRGGSQSPTRRDWVTEVRHIDGRSWRVLTQARASDVLRAESCGKALAPMTYFVTALTQTR